MPIDPVTVPSSEPLIIRKNEDGETVDEVIAKNCYFHIEQMSATGFWFCVNDSHFHIGSRNGRSHIDLTITDLDDRSTPSSDPEGGARGVQGSIATKQESCPERALRTETAVREARPSIPSDGFNCIYLYEDGREVGCLNGPQDDPAVIARANHWTSSLTKTPSADHDDGNLRGLSAPNHQPHAVSQIARDALNDALAGWRYIRKNHGDLYGVGWDRVERKICRSLVEDLIARGLAIPDDLTSPPSPAKTGGAE